ncbi:MAG: SUMF1/EgtB/PvdO family nonheme iron enzyme [Bryobacteraceae bacterium]
MTLATATTLRAQLEEARRRSDQIFGLLAPGALYDRAVDERHRFLFYLGHLEAFDWNLLCKHAMAMPPFQASFDQLFAFGIDPDASGLPTDGPGDWPTEEEVQSYCSRVRGTVDRILDQAPEQLVHVAIEHRLMHAETLAYLLHNMPLDRMIPHEAPTGGSPETAADNRWCVVRAGVASLGMERGSGFGWDNEFPLTRVSVPEFAIAKYKVSNGDYLRFVMDGGTPSHFWRYDDGDWKLRTMFAEIALPLDWPVYVTQAQARDYAAWSGGRLATEAQYHRAAEGAPESACGNVDFRGWDPVSVQADAEGDSHWGVSQLVGNGWEWTRDLFRPFPGFEPFEFYPGYSANFFDEDHYVMKGGSPRTAEKMLRRSFRNWFRDDYKYVFATFRCVDE